MSMSKNCISEEDAQETPIESEEDEEVLQQKLDTVRSKYDKQREEFKSKLPSELEQLRIEIADLRKEMDQQQQQQQPIEDKQPMELDKIFL